MVIADGSARAAAVTLGERIRRDIAATWTPAERARHRQHRYRHLADDAGDYDRLFEWPTGGSIGPSPPAATASSAKPASIPGAPKVAWAGWRSARFCPAHVRIIARSHRIKSGEATKQSEI